ncbi:Sodium-dependent multivitamin transporter, partial [Armadillidium vulgare]
MGNRRMHNLPVSMSLLTSVVSSFNVLGYSAEVYANGMQISTLLVGIILAIIFSSYLLIPVLYPLKLTSINE